ncbi:MAG: class I SAM-dependent methyltransferase [Planctomycetota bacterium]
MTRTDSISTTITACRSCGSERLTSFLDLGATPLADHLPREQDLGKEEHVVRLEVVFCEDCGLVQITETVQPEVLFCRDYPYYSSVSPSLMEHFRSSAERIMETRGLGPDSCVIEAASNDGYMLRHFAEAGIQVLGIDPAEGQAKAARERGVETLNTFFGAELARDLANEGRRADVFLANNVLAHVADLNGFVAGIETLLAEDGVAVIECPYLLRLIEHCEFDTIYHQHLCYFSVIALQRLFEQHGLHLNDVEETAIHGGSLRLFVERSSNPSERMLGMIAAERDLGVDGIDYYRTFSERVQGLREDLVGLLASLKADGKRIVGYGAPAKGCTMMSYCGIGTEQLDYLVDLNPVKHDRFTAVNHLRIHAPDRLLDDQPHYALILPWNFSEEIMRQQAEFIARGGRFIVPVPEVRVLP